MLQGAVDDIQNDENVQSFLLLELQVATKLDLTAKKLAASAEA